MEILEKIRSTFLWTSQTEMLKLAEDWTEVLIAKIPRESLNTAYIQAVHYRAETATTVWDKRAPILPTELISAFVPQSRTSVCAYCKMHDTDKSLPLCPFHFPKPKPEILDFHTD